MSELTSQQLRARAAQSRQDALYYRKRSEPLTEECADAMDIVAGAREKLADALDEIGLLRAEVARLRGERRNLMNAVERALNCDCMICVGCEEELGTASGLKGGQDAKGR